VPSEQRKPTKMSVTSPGSTKPMINPVSANTKAAATT
jgi:hypothetical protein